MDIIVYLLYFTSLFLSDLTAQECNPSIEVAPCGAAEICRNGICETAVPCNSPPICSGLPGTFCISDYCQPYPCAATGQCVTDLVCSQNTMRSCVNPVFLSQEEGFSLTLNFAESATSGTYEEISWYKGSTDGSDRIVWVHPVTGEEPWYYGDYCSDGSSSCATSEKGSLDKATGNLTINQVELSDEGYYYYKFYTTDVSPDTGHKYEYHLAVQVIPESDNILFDGVNETIEAGTNLSLTCTVSRIKPKAADFHLSINDTRVNATINITHNTDSTKKQVATYFMGIEASDHGKPIKCVVDDVNGQRIEKEAIINVAYGPVGNPTIVPDGASVPAGNTVSLTCINPIDDGNPNCSRYLWYKDGSDEIFASGQSYVFTMSENQNSSFSCTCRNDYGVSLMSEAVRVTAVEELGLLSGVDIGLIVGLIVGGVVLVAIVGGLVFFMRRYDIKFSRKKKSAHKKPTNSQASVYENCQPESKPRKEDVHEYAQPYVQATTIPQVYHQAKLPKDETPVGLYEDIKEGEMIAFNTKKGKVNHGMAIYQN